MISTISRRLRELLAARGISIEEFAKMCDLPMETVRSIYYGKSMDPKASTLLKMADALGVGVNCLMGKCQHTPEERALIKYYRQCGTHGRSIISLIAKYEAVVAKEERDTPKKHSIPCLIPNGDIYQGILYDDCKVEEIYTTNKDAYAAIRMVNNDLVPKYCEGDIILIANRFPKQHEYGVFYQNGRAYIREFIKEENQYRLKCLHNYAKDMVFKRMDEINYIGTCCGVVRA